MDKINNINFTGIRNIGTIVIKRDADSISNCLSMELLDNIAGKDIQEFKSVLKKITNKPEEFADPNNANILNLEFIHAKKDNQNFLSIFVNGGFLEVEDKTLPMFSYLAKITRRIKNMPEKEMVVNNDYKEFMADKTLLCDEKLSECIDKNIQFSYDQFFEKDTVKSSADAGNQFIQLIMNQFFGIK